MAKAARKCKRTYGYLELGERPQSGLQFHLEHIAVPPWNLPPWSLSELRTSSRNPTAWKPRYASSTTSGNPSGACIAQREGEQLKLINSHVFFSILVCGPNRPLISIGAPS